MPQDTVTTLSGVCGKLPGRGDFFDSGLPWELNQPLSEWLQALIGVSREQLQQRWLDDYLTAPVWRFATTAGAFGPYGCSGVMIPSVDRVGRYFPLVVVKTHHWSPLELHLKGGQWFDNVGALALSALEPEANPEQFLARVKALPPQLEAPLINSPHQGLHTAQGSRYLDRHPWQMPLQEAGSLAGVQMECLHHLLAHVFPAYSLWWTEGSRKVAPTCLVCSGLPPVSGYAAMLDGQWQQWGWETHNFLGLPAAAGETADG